MTVSNKDKNSNEDNHTEIDPLDELNKIDDYDAVISTTIVPDSIKDKVIQGLPLLNGMGVDQVYDQLKTRLEL